MGSSFPSTAKAIFWRDDFLPQHDTFTGDGHVEEVGAAMHLVCGPVNVHPQPPKHEMFHQVSLHLPQTLALPWICLQICIWLKAKLLLVSGLAVFCCRELIHPKPTQLWSHSMTWACKHSSSPRWHTLAFPHTPRFPPRLQKSHCAIMPGLDSLAAVISPTSPPQHFWAFPRSLRSGIAVWQNYSHYQFYSRFPGKQSHFSLINRFPLSS